MTNRAATPNEPWVCAALSDVGEYRSHNEDAFLARPECGIWLVADGMGGHEGGAFASQAVVDSVAKRQSPESLSLAERIRAVTDSLYQANRLLLTESELRGRGVMGSTVAALLLAGRQAVRIWAGDSRVYRLRQGQMTQLTRDHSLVEESVARGIIDREAAAEQPLSNEITRAVGAERDLGLAVEMGDLLAGDKYLLCSDGLYGEVAQEQLSVALALDDPTAACADLVSQAKRNGGRDNITVIIVHAR